MKPDPSTTLERVSAVRTSEQPRYGTRDSKAVMIGIILPKVVLYSTSSRSVVRLCSSSSCSRSVNQFSFRRQPVPVPSSTSSRSVVRLFSSSSCSRSVVNPFPFRRQPVLVPSSACSRRLPVLVPSSTSSRSVVNQFSFRRPPVLVPSTSSRSVVIQSFRQLLRDGDTRPRIVKP